SSAASTGVSEPTSVLSAIDAILANYGGLSPLTPERIMPLKDRNFNRAFNLITANVLNNLRGSVSKADFHLVVCAGAPGIGKTRYGMELYSHLKDNWITPTDKRPSRWGVANIRFHYIHLDFGNGIKLDVEDYKILNPSIIIGLRIAYGHFIQGKYKTTFETFRRHVGSHVDLFNISDVLESIQQDLGYSDDLQLFLYLHIDEFQLLDQWDCNNKEQGRPITNLFKETINSLASFMLSNSSIFVQTFLSGTAPRIIIAAKETSRVSFGFESCPLLSFRAMFEIAEHYAVTCQAEKFECGTFKWTLCKRFLQLLEDTGGLPRAIDLLFQECFSVGQSGRAFFGSIDTLNFDTIFTNIKVGLRNRYNLYRSAVINKPLILALLQYSISGSPVRHTTILIPNDKHSTIDNLECDNHIMLDPIKNSPGDFTVKMPFFFICLYNDTLRVVNCQLEDAFSLQRGMDWQSWELF
ncbi:hypothetical protein BGZ76_006232, partial [Entomortierella beljakovae]